MPGRGAALIITVLAAAGLLALGASLGWEWRESEVINLREAAVKQGNRAGGLLAQIQSLEQRLTKSREALERCRREVVAPSPPPPPPKGEPGPGPGPGPGIESKVLLRGTAQLALGGRVSLTLLEVSPDRKRAELLVRVLGGGEGRTVLSPGQSKTFTVDKERWHLVLKSIHASTANLALVPARRP